MFQNGKVNKVKIRNIGRIEFGKFGRDWYCQTAPENATLAPTALRAWKNWLCDSGEKVVDTKGKI